MGSIVTNNPENVHLNQGEVEGCGSGKCSETHTPCPKGYIQWHAWAEEKGKTHNQIRCPHCNLYAVWVPKR